MWRSCRYLLISLFVRLLINEPISFFGFYVNLCVLSSHTPRRPDFPSSFLSLSFAVNFKHPPERIMKFELSVSHQGLLIL